MWASLALLAAGASGCPSFGPDAIPCQVDDNCPTGQSCHAGLCVEGPGDASSGSTSSAGSSGAASSGSTGSGSSSTGTSSSSSSSGSSASSNSSSSSGSSTGGPTLTGVSPSAITSLTAVDLVVSGSGFQDTTTADLDGEPLSIATLAGTRLTLHATSTQVGAAREANLHVNNPTGTSALTVEVDNPVPTLTSISPNTATHHSGTATLTLTGSDFRPDSVAMADSSAMATTYVSETELMAVVPGNKLNHAGNVQISVRAPAPGGGVSASVTLTVN
ncbi:MAG: IPT/TIG domain-containing protein [Deltaproteobacteria bacterium]|nr:IPT/TIG domain-containing protein [Deltaproteobacteria bacterium]